MSSSARKSVQGLFPLLLLGAISVFVATSPYSADARGGRGGGVSSGGFSRSSVASGGSLSVPAAAVGQRSERNAAGASQPRDARNASGVGEPGGVRSASGVGQPRGVSSAGDVGAVADQREGRKVDRVTPEQMAEYRRQFQQQNKDSSVDWDARHPVDPGYSVPAPGEGTADSNDAGKKIAAASAVVTAGVVARSRADDYVDFVNTVDDPSYLAEDDCSIKAVTEVNDVKYYRCSNAWYKRGYQGGSVVYIPTDTPPGQ